MTRCLSLLLLLAPAMASAEPVPYRADARVRTADYVADGVIPVPVSTGVVTRVVLERGEKIVAAATGVPATCESDDHLWCIVANADANELWIKPKAGARRNNLELKTDRRDYSFEMMVGATTTYRIALRYPAPAATKQAAPPAGQTRVNAQTETAEPIARNTAYTLESNRKGADIRPVAVFDDGRFTYFRFPGNREVPTIFVIGSDGAEARTNFNMAGDYVVVQRLGRKFVLRLGKSVVSVWNEAFDADGVAPVEGTTVPGVARVTAGGKDAG